MIFRPTGIAGVHVIDPERRADERGWFARTFCAEAFAAHGLAGQFVQCSASFNARRGTVRGLHFQRAPWAEAKLVRCVRGRVFDVAVDLRPGSPTRGRWTAAELGPDTGRMMYVPEGCAHGFQTLEDGTELVYQITAPYRPEHAEGVRWDDPAIGIEWPLAAAILSPRDRAWPGLADLEEAVC